MSDLDAILDAALDDFDAAVVTPAPIASPAVPAASTGAVDLATPAQAAAVAPSTGGAAPSIVDGLDPALMSDPASIQAFQAFFQAMSPQTLGEAMQATAGDDADAAGSAADPPSQESVLEMQREMNLMLQQMAELAKLQGGTPGATGSAALAASTSAAGVTSTATAIAAVSSSDSAPTTSSGDPIQDAIRMISQGASSLPAGGPAGFEGIPGGEAGMEAMLTKLMAEMGGGGGVPGAGSGDMGSDASMDAMVEQMMGSMLSKEHLYQPMKDIAAKYPTYLREHADTLSATDLANYRAQQACFERIVALFESTPPGSSMKIMELMNEMQQYGTPPKEVVADFTPPGFDPNTPMPPGMASLALAGDGMGGIPKDMDPAQLKAMTDDACKTQ